MDVRINVPVDRTADVGKLVRNPNRKRSQHVERMEQKYEKNNTHDGGRLFEATKTYSLES